MGEAQARARRQQEVEELCAAAIRAVAGDADLHFRGERLHRGLRRLPRFAPHLHPSLDSDDFASFRGAADGLALRVSRSDAELHAQRAPEEPVARLLFDLLEQLRVESLAPADMPGLRHNLRHRFEQWSLAFHDSRLTETASGLLLYAVAQVCRSRVTGEPVLEATEGVIELTRGMLAAQFGSELAGLRRHRTDQAAYAPHALVIARTIAGMIEPPANRPGKEGEGGDDSTRRAFDRLLGPEEDVEDDGFAVADSGRSRVLEDSVQGYAIYTRAYDREVEAATLVRRALLAEYRARLDRRVAEQGLNLARLARELRALLAVPTQDGFDGAQDEGQIDGRRLAQLVSSPTERRLFRIDRIEPVPDSIVSFLIDCSGSMRQHVEWVGVLVDVFVRALELAGVRSEILGFTTAAWNGGRARRDWMRAGRPRHPGRLNEACHLVFKAIDTPWRRARPAIAALLKGDLFREGIDGEAVDWACARMREGVAGRRTLLVVSDGSPMDTATQLANDPHYLDHHLREVVARNERSGEVDICGIGIGLDLSPYYRRSRAFDPSSPPGNQTLHEIVEMIAGRGRR
jgi:cobaltochelatase CobT